MKRSGREDARVTPAVWRAVTGWVARALLLGSLPAGAAAAEVDGPLAAPIPSDYGLRTFEGEVVEVGSLLGAVTVVNFWASWCKPCRTELPQLDRWHQRLASEGGRVIAISVDSDVERARRFVSQSRLRLPVFHDGAEGLARTLDLPHLPCTLVLDETGRTVSVHRGVKKGGFAEMERTVASLLAAGNRDVTARPAAQRQ